MMFKKMMMATVLGLGLAGSTMAIAADTSTSTTENGATTAASTTPAFMSPAWAKELCTAWNNNPTLTEKLAGSWIKNNGGKGYKLMEVSDSSMKTTPPIQLEIAAKDGKAECTYGGAIKVADLNYSYDYKMWATTHDWHHMGSPAMAMMFGRLNFKGPKMEAMENMGPFSEFLKLIKEVPATVPAS
ncbi:SCP2 sterol-binding domain-containing protein [Acidithiobacillus sulfurivorans]|nr:SCP2 sterol-binding domain-containing protein [Acidithiobacillus sulfurivorans]